MDTDTEIHELIDRLSRLHAAGMRNDDLNPTQMAALGYLTRANRFSRTPSLVADFMATTRGTASQTVKALVRKGLIEEAAVKGDKRAVSLQVTPKGQAVARNNDVLLAAIAALPEALAASMAAGLKEVVQGMLQYRGGRSFGICKACRHHIVSGDATRCALLDVELEPEERDQICFEHVA